MNIIFSELGNQNLNLECLGIQLVRIKNEFYITDRLPYRPIIVSYEAISQMFPLYLLQNRVFQIFSEVSLSIYLLWFM